MDDDGQTHTPHARVRAPPRPRVLDLFQRRPGSWNAGEPIPLVTAVEFPFRTSGLACRHKQQACEHEMNVRRGVLKWKEKPQAKEKWLDSLNPTVAAVGFGSDLYPATTQGHFVTPASHFATRLPNKLTKKWLK